MVSYKVTVIEPSALETLEEMARKNLIALSPLDSTESFSSLLAKLRHTGSAPSADEIQNEVEAVRSDRLANQV